jgi:hypothetical protein
MSSLVSGRPSRIPALILFLASLTYALCAATVGWHNTVLDFIPFRQSQTALTALFMVGRMPTLAYETPVVGPPWAIPFELPVYQWIVAGLISAFGTPLEETGRFVSLVFFLLCLLPGWSILAFLGLSSSHRLVALSLFLVSPFYIFWSRTFLIESTALFFALAYLALALPCVRRPTPARLLTGSLLGVLAALVKITTFAAVLPAFLVVVAWAILHRRHLAHPLLRAALLLLVLGAVPTAAGFLWTRYADSLKEQNPIGRDLTSTAPLMREWNFGTHRQRRDPEVRRLIFRRINYAVGHWGLLVAAGLAVAGSRRYRPAFLACLLLYLPAPLVFTNLYYFHEYYAYANHFFLLAALALGLSALLERGGWFRCTAIAGLVVFLVLAVRWQQTYYRPIQAYNVTDLEAVGAVVRQETAADDVIVVIGYDWSSAVPYSCRRRALAIPQWRTPTLEKVPSYLALEPPWRPGALVICNQWTRYDPVQVLAVLRTAGFAVRHIRVDEQFDVYALTPTASPKHSP